MNEVKTPKKPLIVYYAIAILVVLLINTLLVPMVSQARVKYVDYGTFIQMTEEDKISEVQVQDNQIIFVTKEDEANKNAVYYRTGKMDDPELTSRLSEHGVRFDKEIVEETSPLLSFLLSFVFPIVLFIALGQLLTRQMMKRMGGGKGAMSFGMGNSNAKVYVKDSAGSIKFDDVAGEDEAKEKAPCIVFIDEIDAIGKKRDGGKFGGGNDEREQTLNQLLTEMDGFEGNNGVIILAATNRPESLDPALTRPGRFDRRVPVELPDLQGREAILRVHAKKIKTEPNINYAQIARMASGASGAELANIVNEAALRAVRNHRTAASQADMEESIEVVIAGYQKKNAILTDKEKSIVSYHEIGHALVAALQSHSAPVQKITIVPRTSGALGYTMQVDEGNHYLMTKDEIINKIATLTAGRVAEEIVFGSITTGASNDIEQATKLARAMITRYGMSDEFGMVAMETVENAYLGGDTSLSCSAETQARIDALVVSIVKEQYQKATQILTDNRAKLDELAKYLYEKETITGEEFMNILNKKEA